MLNTWQKSIINTGLVTPNYKIDADLAPVIQPMVNSLLQPMLQNIFARVPDETIPALAHSVVDGMAEKETYTIMDGLVTFEKEDIAELKQLIEINLPLVQADNYQLIKE